MAQLQQGPGAAPPQPQTRRFIGYDAQGREVYDTAPAPAPVGGRSVGPGTAGMAPPPSPATLPQGGPAPTGTGQGAATGGRGQGPGTPPPADPIEALKAEIAAGASDEPAAEQDEMSKSPFRRLIGNFITTMNPIPLMKDLFETGAKYPWYSATAMSTRLGTKITMAQLGEISKAKDIYNEAMMQPEGSLGRNAGIIRAGGHLAAGLVPLVGPPAAHAGEQFATGDIAGGIGTTAGLLVPFGAAKLAGAVKSPLLNAAGKLADRADRMANEKLTRVAAPGTGPEKYRLGRMVTDRAPELLRDPDMAAWSRASLQDKVNAASEVAKTRLDAAYDNLPANADISTAAIKKGIQAELDKLVVKGEFDAKETVTQTGPVVREGVKPPASTALEGPWREVPPGGPPPTGPTGMLPAATLADAPTAMVPLADAMAPRSQIPGGARPAGAPPIRPAQPSTSGSPGMGTTTSERTVGVPTRMEPSMRRARIGALKQALAELNGVGDRISIQQLRNLAQSWSEGAKKVYTPAEAADHWAARGEGHGWASAERVARQVAVDKYPSLAPLNQKSSLYRAFSDVMQAAEDARLVSRGPQITAMGRRLGESIVGATAGAAAGGAEGAILGGILAPILDAAVTSGVTSQVGVARALTRMADAVRAGKVAAAEIELSRAAQTVGAEVTKKAKEELRNLFRNIAGRTGNEAGSIPGPGGKVPKYKPGEEIPTGDLGNRGRGGRSSVSVSDDGKVVYTHTHYGRGTPPTAAAAEAQVRKAYEVAKEMSPDGKVYAHMDEDWAFTGYADEAGVPGYSGKMGKPRAIKSADEAVQQWWDEYAGGLGDTLEDFNAATPDYLDHFYKRFGPGGLNKDELAKAGYTGGGLSRYDADVHNLKSKIANKVSTLSDEEVSRIYRLYGEARKEATRDEMVANIQSRIDMARNRDFLAGVATAIGEKVADRISPMGSDQRASFNARRQVRANLTQQQAFDQIKKLGMAVRKTPEGEYRVAFPGRDTEASAYYTNDLQDAIDTAKAMKKEGNKRLVINERDADAIYEVLQNDTRIDKLTDAVMETLPDTPAGKAIERAIRNSKPTVLSLRGAVMKAMEQMEIGPKVSALNPPKGKPPGKR